VNRKTKFMLGSALIVAAVGALIYGAVRETSAYFVTMDEYARNPAQHEGQPLRLAGRVADGSVKWDPKTLDLEFVVRPIPPRKDAAAPGDAAPVPNAASEAGDGAAPTANATLPVRYNGILPDMFAAGRDVIVEGRVENGVFHAKALLTTCPSKYEAERKGGVEAGSAPNGEGDQARVAPPGGAGEPQPPQASAGPGTTTADSPANGAAPDQDAKPNDGELLWADLA
jgi:cytochrome c-type biogenesis protein CcmE